MFYAIRTIDDAPINVIKSDWMEVKPMVINKNCIYKAFVDYNDAALYIKEAQISQMGYERTSKNANAVYGKFLFSRYFDTNNGYSCCVYQTKELKRVTCVGYNLPRIKNVTYKFKGCYAINEKFGTEFRVDNFEEIIEDTKEGVIAYLSSGVVKGIGEKKAKAIYDTFGIHTMEVLEKHPERLRYVKGFSENLAKKTIEELEKNKGAKDITRFLLKYGISQKIAMAIYNEKKATSLEYVKQNPFRLCSLFNVSFDTADEIASSVGLPKNNPYRLDQAIFHVLIENEVTGSTGMEWNDFTKKVFFILKNEVSKEDLAARLVDLKEHSAIKLVTLNHMGKRGKYLFLTSAYDREEEIANDVIRLRDSKAVLSIKDLDKRINDEEVKLNITLDACQRNAIKEALSESPFIVIKGKPGTGKTTTIKIIASLYEEDGGDVVFVAPTGRAARRMTETSGRKADTIHSKLNIFDEDTKAEDIIIEKALIVVDEVSMLDVHTARLLFSSIKSGCRVVLVGDPNQLPSVGPGAVLRDLIESETVKVASLDKVHRQKQESKIYSNCEKINAGDGNVEDGEDFSFIESSNMEDIKNIMAEKYLEAVKKYGVLNTMCLCPFKKHIAGVIDMNDTLQDIINPRELGTKEIKAHGEIFRIGDPVMHLKNKKEASNGDIGLVTSIDEEDKSLTVKINDNELEFDRDTLDRLTRSYASTVHKSQGSEADAVIFSLSFFHKAMLFKNIPYVALSRGKKQVTVIGEREAFIEAAKCEAKNTRVTLLQRFLRLKSYKCVEV